VSDSAAQSNASTSGNSSNELLTDQLTALLYHVERSHACGSNLQKFRIANLDLLWAKKFHAQVKKATHLANLLNHLIYSNSEHAATSPMPFSASSTASRTSPPKSWPHLSNYILGSNFLESLSYFMLSNAQTPPPHGPPSTTAFTSTKTSTRPSWNGTEAFPSVSTTPFGDANNYTMSRKHVTTPRKSDENTNDIFLVGYGVVLNENEDPTAAERLKCLFISQNPDFAMNKNQNFFVKETSCSSMNIKKASSSGSSTSDNSDFVSVSNEEDELDGEDENADEGFDADEVGHTANIIKNGDAQTSLNDDLFKNCMNWYATFKETYQAAVDNKTLFKDKKSMHFLNSHFFLDKLMNSSTFGLSVWCGPYRLCGGKK
jgi:hypothetical protein